MIETREREKVHCCGSHVHCVGYMCGSHDALCGVHVWIT